MPGLCGLIELERRAVGPSAAEAGLLDRMLAELLAGGDHRVLARIDDGPFHVVAVGQPSRCHRVLREPEGATDRELWYGEVYAGRERPRESPSDGTLRFQTELARAGAGDEALARVAGCFVGLRYRPHDGAFDLFTDRLAALPICTRRVGRYLLFAPETKALLVEDKESLSGDAGALGFFLSAGYLPPERTHFEQVRRLPPAAVLGGRAAVDGRPADAPRCRRYWHYEFAARAEDRGAEVHAQELTERLRETVAMQVAPGERGCVCLSGGVDSRGVLGLVLEVADGVDAVTWGYDPSLPDSDIEIASRIAAAARLRHSIVRLEPAALPAHAAPWVWSMDGSLDGLYNYPQGGEVFHAIAEDHDVIYRGEQAFLRWPYAIPDEDAAKAAISLRTLGEHGFWKGILRADAWRALEGADRRVHDEIAARLVSRDPGDRKQEYFYAVHHYCKMNVLNYFKMLSLPVRNPLLDPHVLDLMRSLPRRYRQGKELFHQAIAAPVARFGEIPWATRTNLIPWTRVLAEQPALGSFVIETVLSAQPSLADLFDRGLLERELRGWLAASPAGPEDAAGGTPSGSRRRSRAWAKRLLYSPVVPRSVRARVVRRPDHRRRMPYLFRLLVLSLYLEELRARGIRLDWALETRA